MEAPRECNCGCFCGRFCECFCRFFEPPGDSIPSNRVRLNLINTKDGSVISTVTNRNTKICQVLQYIGLLLKTSFDMIHFTVKSDWNNLVSTLVPPEKCFLQIEYVVEELPAYDSFVCCDCGQTNRMIVCAGANTFSMDEKGNLGKSHANCEKNGGHSCCSDPF
jgi:hypothetical protein